jgi:hypothetical protein
MNKTIQINPELFKIGTKKITSKPKNISIKVPNNKNKNIAKRNALLKFIRRHQDSNIQHVGENVLHKEEESDSDFERSLQYLMNVTESPSTPHARHTMKNCPVHENVSMNFPDTQSALPQYGCLKNGTLPTYRQFYNRQTLKNHTGMGAANTTTVIELPSIPLSNTLGNIDEHQDIKAPVDVEHTKRKLLKRSYKIGKSDCERKISILVSNKTLRHQTSNKSISLKKTPLIDVRRYLVKKGLIKIGTSAPPDVLRKMYESASMVCGDITNHNQETLMYNFLNPEKKSW